MKGRATDGPIEGVGGSGGRAAVRPPDWFLVRARRALAPKARESGSRVVTISEEVPSSGREKEKDLEFFALAVPPSSILGAGWAPHGLFVVRAAGTCQACCPAGSILASSLSSRRSSVQLPATSFLDEETPCPSSHKVWVSTINNSKATSCRIATTTSTKTKRWKWSPSMPSPRRNGTFAFVLASLLVLLVRVDNGWLFLSWLPSSSR